MLDGEMTGSDEEAVLGALLRARAARAGGDERGELEALLEAWRARRAAEVAELLAHVSARVTKQLPAITGKTGKETLVRWMERARAGDPVDTEQLLAGLGEAWPSGRADIIGPRLEELEKRADDPRVGGAVLALLRAPTMRGQGAWSKVWRRAVHAIEATGDPRLAPELEALAQELRHNIEYGRSELRARLTAVATALRERFPTGAPRPTERERELIKAIAATTPGAPQPLAPHAPKTGARATEAELLAAIYAHPEDDEPRHVYADFLQEQGDARGEFIALQLRRARGVGTEKELARERMLLRKNARAWLGPLAKVVPLAQATFERGFLAVCTVELKTDTMAATELSHPEWATVRAIRFTKSSAITEAMRGVEEASGLTNATMRRLCKTGHPRLTGIGFYDGTDIPVIEGPHSLSTQALASCAPLPRLRRLRLAGDGSRGWMGEPPLVQRHRSRTGPPWIWSAPFAATLEFVSVTDRLAKADHIEAWLDEIASWPAQLRTFELTESRSGMFEPDGLSVQFERDARGAFTVVTVHHRGGVPEATARDLDGPLAKLLAALPVARVTRLAVESDARAATAEEGWRSVNVAQRFTRLESPIRWPPSISLDWFRPK